MKVTGALQVESIDFLNPRMIHLKLQDEKISETDGGRE
jgi:hypothetical protein